MSMRFIVTASAIAAASVIVGALPALAQQRRMYLRMSHGLAAILLRKSRDQILEVIAHVRSLKQR